MHGKRPRTVWIGQKKHRVLSIPDYWVIQSRWWRSEEKRCYLRLVTDSGLIEIYRRDDQWILSRIWD
jgi:hypothetical protein